MNPEMKKKIEAYFAAHEADMIRDLCELVEIPSARTDAQKDMPYGPGAYEALQCGMKLMEQKGLLNVRSWDNRLITGDLTELPSGLDILAHLDVVPALNNWTVCEPYKPTMVGRDLYGRGTSDDKGPAIAALYAMDCARSLGIPFKKNVRLILGSDEECGSSDVEWYYSRVPEAPMTFTPDCDFPLINLEKGHLHGEIDGKFARDTRTPYIESADAGIKFNVIPETAEAVVVGISCEALAPYFEKAAAATGASFSAEVQADSKVKILCKGKSGHAAFPEDANNAQTALLTLLASLPCADSEGFRSICALHRLFPHGDFYGAAIGIAMEDEISGKLTCSPDLLHIDETSLYLLFDSRCSVCANEENTVEAAKKTVSEAGLSMRDTALVAPHYVSADSDFVRTLLRVYTDWTGKPGEALSTGGGTYVHSLKNGVAFGAGLPEIDCRIHGADEFIPIDLLLLSGKIFAQAIIELCC